MIIEGKGCETKQTQQKNSPMGNSPMGNTTPNANATRGKDQGQAKPTTGSSNAGCNVKSASGGCGTGCK